MCLASSRCVLVFFAFVQQKKMNCCNCVYDVCVCVRVRVCLVVVCLFPLFVVRVLGATVCVCVIVLLVSYNGKFHPLLNIVL